MPVVRRVSINITSSHFSSKAGKTQYLLTTDGRLLPIVVRSKVDTGSITKQAVGDRSQTTTKFMIRKRTSAPGTRTGSVFVLMYLEIRSRS